MATKLTLSLDSKVIDAAKKYAEKKGTSISKMVEEYLSSVTLNDHKKKLAKNSLMELRGILGKVPPDFDYKEERFKYLMKKYK